MKVLLRVNLCRNTGNPAELRARFSRHRSPFSEKRACYIGRRAPCEHLGLDFGGGPASGRALEVRIDGDPVRTAGDGSRREGLPLSTKNRSQVLHKYVLEHITGDGIHAMAPARRLDHMDHSRLLLVALVALAV